MFKFNFIRYNKSRVVILTEDKAYWTNNCWDHKEFNLIEDFSKFPKLSSLNSEFQTFANDVETAYYNYVGFCIKEREPIRLKNQLLKEKINLIADNPDNYTALEIYQAANFINKNENSYRGADVLLKSEVFKLKMFEHFKTFTVTPFDNGLLLIKCNDKINFGNHRGYQDLEPYLK